MLQDITSELPILLWRYSLSVLFFKKREREDNTSRIDIMALQAKALLLRIQGLKRFHLDWKKVGCIIIDLTLHAFYYVVETLQLISLLHEMCYWQLVGRLGLH